MPADPFEIVPLTPARRDDLLAFFEQRAFVDHPQWASCYCHFPHADHAAIAWERRSAADNRRASAARIDAGTMQGWLARDASGVVGWCNAGPRAWIAGMFDDVEPLQADIGAIVCFVVTPERRGQGIARALLTQAVDGLRGQGFTWAEAYPRREAANASANHYGPLSMYLADGFTVHRPDGDNALVVRKRLRGDGGS